MTAPNADEKTAKGMLWSLARTWGRRGVSTISFLILVGLLSPDEFGLVAWATVFIGGIQVIMDLGLNDAIVQREDLRDEHLHSSFWLSIVVGLAFFTLFQVAASPLADVLDEPRLAAVLRWLSVVFIFNGVSVVPQALLHRDVAFKELAVREFAAITVGGVVGIVMAVRGAGAWALVGQQLAWAVVLLIVLWMMTPYRPRFVLKRAEGMDLLRFGVHRIGFKGLRFANQNLADFLIGLILGPTALGFYAVAYRVINIATDAFVEAVNAVAFPTLARMTSDKQLFRTKVTNGVGMVVLAAFPAFLGLIAIAALAVEMFLKPEWQPTVTVLRGLAVMGIAMSVASFSRSAILGYGRAGVTLVLQAIATVASLVAVLIAIPFGIGWVGIALGIQAVLLLPVEMTALRRTTPIELPAFLRQLWGPLVAGLVMCGVAFGVISLTDGINDLVRLLAAVAAGVATYALGIRFLAKAQFERASRAVLTALRRPSQPARSA
ncbi:MAG: lipopolysaccharide biosynthesis protein [Acidimicrobiia bacterium]|nr:lipopolysaccharide biosynthesis protein [Acidimicrobiia bacterium]